MNQLTVAVAAWAALLWAGCQNPLEPVAQVVRMDSPPPHYRAAYGWVWQHCYAPRPAAVPYERIRWYVVNAPYWVVDGRLVAGEWYRRSHRLLMTAEAIDSARHGTYVLRHELLHAVGVQDHPAGVFERCDSLAVAAGWAP